MRIDLTARRYSSGPSPGVGDLWLCSSPLRQYVCRDRDGQTDRQTQRLGEREMESATCRRWRKVFQTRTWELSCVDHNARRLRWFRRQAEWRGWWGERAQIAAETLAHAHARIHIHIHSTYIRLLLLCKVSQLGLKQVALLSQRGRAMLRVCQ